MPHPRNIHNERRQAAEHHRQTTNEWRVAASQALAALPPNVQNEVWKACDHANAPALYPRQLRYE